VANLIVGIADCKVSRDPEATIVTYALGSCIALILYDPVQRAGGLLHFMLPSSQNDPRQAEANPAMYGDSGLPLLFREMQKLGANSKRLVAHIAGGGQMLESHAALNIGKRNQIMIKNLLWKAGILIQSESVGGAVTRSVGLQVATGQVWLKQSETIRPSGGLTGERNGISSIGCR
jgi:chemotaxis protein CheD